MGCKATKDVASPVSSKPKISSATQKDCEPKTNLTELELDGCVKPKPFLPVLEPAEVHEKTKTECNAPELEQATEKEEVSNSSPELRQAATVGSPLANGRAQAENKRSGPPCPQEFSAAGLNDLSTADLKSWLKHLGIKLPHGALEKQDLVDALLPYMDHVRRSCGEPVSPSSPSKPAWSTAQLELFDEARSALRTIQSRAIALMAVIEQDIEDSKGALVVSVPLAVGDSVWRAGKPCVVQAVGEDGEILVRMIGSGEEVDSHIGRLSRQPPDEVSDIDLLQELRSTLRAVAHGAEKEGRSLAEIADGPPVLPAAPSEDNFGTLTASLDGVCAKLDAIDSRRQAASLSCAQEPAKPALSVANDPIEIQLDDAAIYQMTVKQLVKQLRSRKADMTMCIEKEDLRKLLAQHVRSAKKNDEPELLALPPVPGKKRLRWGGVTFHDVDEKGAEHRGTAGAAWRLREQWRFGKGGPAIDNAEALVESLLAQIASISVAQTSKPQFVAEDVVKSQRALAEFLRSQRDILKKTELWQLLDQELCDIDGEPRHDALHRLNPWRSKQSKTKGGTYFHNWVTGVSKWRLPPGIPKPLPQQSFTSPAQPSTSEEDVVICTPRCDAPEEFLVAAEAKRQQKTAMYYASVERALDFLLSCMWDDEDDDEDDEFTRKEPLAGWLPGQIEETEPIKKPVRDDISTDSDSEAKVASCKSEAKKAELEGNGTLLGKDSRPDSPEEPEGPPPSLKKPEALVRGLPPVPRPSSPEEPEGPPPSFQKPEVQSPVGGLPPVPQAFTTSPCTSPRAPTRDDISSNSDSEVKAPNAHTSAQTSANSKPVCDEQAKVKVEADIDSKLKAPSQETPIGKPVRDDISSNSDSEVKAPCGGLTSPAPDPVRASAPVKKSAVDEGANWLEERLRNIRELKDAVDRGKRTAPQKRKRSAIDSAWREK